MKLEKINTWNKVEFLDYYSYLLGENKMELLSLKSRETLACRMADCCLDEYAKDVLSYNHSNIYLMRTLPTKEEQIKTLLKTPVGLLSKQKIYAKSLCLF